MKLLVGLGNPGTDYATTRHNAGFLAIDRIAKIHKIPSKPTHDKKSNAEIMSWDRNGEKILLVKPQTFMNNSGETVRKLVDFYKLKPQDVIVLHDDKDFPVGTYKVQTDRGPAGHNGVTSIIDHLGTKNFTRVRIGVGPKESGIECIVDYVLEKFSALEKPALEAALAEIAETVIDELL